jgi:NAD(P)-dependent dehydrogenase (short-subunit alcohol dehydrogenase family)
MRIIVTGANSGVGKATAAALAKDGHSVVIACRNLERANERPPRCRGTSKWLHLT